MKLSDFFKVVFVDQNREVILALASTPGGELREVELKIGGIYGYVSAPQDHSFLYICKESLIFIYIRLMGGCLCLVVQSQFYYFLMW